MKRTAIDNQPSEIEIDKKATFWAGVATAIIMAIFLIVFFFALSDGIEREEKNECLKLKSQEKKVGFFLTPEEKEMCDYAGVKINAPVRQKERR